MEKGVGGGGGGGGGGLSGSIDADSLTPILRWPISTIAVRGGPPASPSTSPQHKNKEKFPVFF